MNKCSIKLLTQSLVYISLLVLLDACSNIPFEPAVSDRAKVTHIVLISIDGLRPDAINIKNAKNLYTLSHAGLYYPDAQTIKRSVTLPSHTSMLTGLDIEQKDLPLVAGQRGIGDFLS